MGLGSPPDTALELSCWPLAGTGSTVFFWGVCSPQALLWGCCELSGVPSGECSSVHMGLGGTMAYPGRMGKIQDDPHGMVPMG